MVLTGETEVLGEKHYARENLSARLQTSTSATLSTTKLVLYVPTWDQNLASAVRGRRLTD